MKRPTKNSIDTLGKRVYEYIRTHILLRNVIVAVCLGVILLFVVNIGLNLFTRHGQKHLVPVFVGQDLTEAQRMARRAGGLQLEVIDSLFMPRQKPGVVLDQSPAAGAGVKSGRRIFLTINAQRPRTEQIPYVTGFSIRQAKNLLENRGFEIERLQYRTDIATNNVLDELYNGVSVRRDEVVMAELGSSVTLVVGVNHSSALPRVPKVVGLTLREAKSRLWEMGINIGEVRNDRDITVDNAEHARVYRQDPNQQSRIDYGGMVSLWLTTDAAKLREASRASDSALRALWP